MKTFWAPGLGNFNSIKDDLSDLDGPYLEAAQHRQAAEKQAADAGKAFCLPGYFYSLFNCHTS